MSKGFYIGSFILGVIASYYITSTHEKIIILTLGIPVGLYLLFVYVWFHREMWTSIQDDYVRTTPNKAAWFLLIPIFNLYWYFVVYPGFVENYNRYIKRKSRKVDRMLLFPFGGYASLHVILVCIEYAYYATIILVLLSGGISEGSPYQTVNMLLVMSRLAAFFAIPLTIVYSMFFLMIISRVCDAVNALSSRPRRKNPSPIEVVTSDPITDPSGTI
jgi:hypothetical protein